MAKIRILLTDDHTLFRLGIRNLIAAESDMEVVGEAVDGAEAITEALETRPDIVLMDIGMPGLAGFAATREIKTNRPETKVLFLTMHDNEDYLDLSMKVGASGYVLKDGPAEQLLSAIREVHHGGSYLSPRMLLQIADDFRSQLKSRQRTPRIAILTRREKEVLKILAEGGSVKEIADGWNLSVKTVFGHKLNLMRKLDIHSQAQLVQYAIEKKIIRIPGASDSGLTSVSPVSK